jgi:hypothetical protein
MLLPVGIYIAASIATALTESTAFIDFVGAWPRGI